MTTTPLNPYRCRNGITYKTKEEWDAARAADETRDTAYAIAALGLLADMVRMEQNLGAEAVRDTIEVWESRKRADAGPTED
jgi:hypothetical protein